MTSSVGAKAVRRLAGIAGLVMAVVTPAFAEPPKLSLELNKLETTDKGCRAYLVVDNGSDAGLQNFKLDLVLFQPDGVIGRRLSLELAPVRPKKRTVKLFDLDGIACDRIASVLVNDVIDCKPEGAAAGIDCLAGLSVKSLTSAQITK